MRLQSDRFPRPQPPAILTLAGLRQAQSQIAALATPIDACTEVTLARAVGRVLAQDLAAAPDAAAPVLARGTRLDARHLPLFGRRNLATACVRARARIGVVALPDADGGAGSSPCHAGASGVAAWIAASVEALGAQPFEATCRAPEPRRFVETLEMFVGGCDLVVTAGFLSPDMCEAVRLAQVRRRQPPAIDTLRLRPFGALQVLQVGKTLVVALSADLELAVAAFTTLLTPLIRRLQGRGDALPDVRAAELDDLGQGDDAHWRVFPAQVEPRAHARVVLKACGSDDAARAIAVADGLAWHAAEFASLDRPTVGWFPFETWAR